MDAYCPMEIELSSEVPSQSLGTFNEVQDVAVKVVLLELEMVQNVGSF